MDKKIKEFTEYLYDVKKTDEIKYSKLIRWLTTYKQYLIYEKKFMPKKLITYKRGDIIKVNFGFNIGNELGGVHYAVVLDNQNSKNSGTLTVVPLSSHKDSDIENKYTTNLGNILQEKLDMKASKLQKSIAENMNQIEKKNKYLKETFDNLNAEMKMILGREQVSRLKCQVIKNPADHGYYAKDKNQFIIRPYNKKGLDSLPNGVYDTIYTEENRIYHTQAIGSLMLNKCKIWELYKENNNKVIFKVPRIGTCGRGQEITTVCTHFLSRTFNEVNSFECGIAQGGEDGDLILCLEKVLLSSIDIVGLKTYFKKIITNFDIEVRYELKKHLIYELPILADVELENPSSILVESEVLSKRKKEVEAHMNVGIEAIMKVEKELNETKKIVELETKVSTELKRTKLGSKALVSQITTISKLRVIDPKSSQNALYEIYLDDINMKKIDEKISSLFFENIDK